MRVAERKTEEATTRNYCIDPQQTLVLYLKRQWTKPISALEPVLRVALRCLFLVRERRSSRGRRPRTISRVIIITRPRDFIVRMQIARRHRCESSLRHTSTLKIAAQRKEKIRAPFWIILLSAFLQVDSRSERVISGSIFARCLKTAA